MQERAEAIGAGRSVPLQQTFDDEGLEKAVRRGLRHAGGIREGGQGRAVAAGGGHLPKERDGPVDGPRTIGLRTRRGGLRIIHDAEVPVTG